MAISLQYNSEAARKLFDHQQLTELEPQLLAARDEVFNDVELLRSGSEIPPTKEPLDAGFLNLPAELLREDEANKSESLLSRIDTAAGMFREEVDRLVLLGIGGSYMGARALFEALCHPFHNQQTREQRQGVPRLAFEGNNIDNDSVRGLLDLLSSNGADNRSVEQRWGIVVISKSGGTVETAVAFRLFREALEKFYGSDSPESRRLVVPITGPAGKLRNLSEQKKYESVFSVPDNVGGRFSIFSAVGLLPAAILGLDIRKLLEGAADITEQFRKAPVGSNPVLDYTAICHLFEKEQGRNIRVLSTWGSRLEAVGLWYDQLLSESLGKGDCGATPLTVVNTRDLHSRGQQHQEGTLDKLITNVIVGAPNSTPLELSTVENDDDGLNWLAGKSLPNLLTAAIDGTNQAYADVNRPTADILLPQLDEHTVGQLLQMLMLTTVLEGRLIGINPYGQPGVEAYKTNMTNILASQ